MMNKAEDAQNDTGDETLDATIAALLDRYLSHRERGTAPDRSTWLAQHPEHAERLAKCLDAVELFEPPTRVPTETHAQVSVGQFDILQEIGRDGMGVVYEARDRSLDRIVALKVMRFGIVDPNALDRFRREAETAGALHHTNIVPVYATGREGDTSWYAMQRIEGESLATIISRSIENETRTDLEQILDVGIQVAEALHHAHQRHVIHRDVKPGNLIVDHSGRVWLTDFGLARRLIDAGATMTGALLGTPRYMSPEQADLCRSEDVDQRSDVFSLGATLYEMACGTPPFQGNDPVELFTKIRYDEPAPPRDHRPDLPADLQTVILKAMEKNVDRRYASAGELANELRAIRDDHPIRARPLSLLERSARYTRKHQSRIKIAMSATVLAVVATLIGLFVLNTWQASQQGRFRIRTGATQYQALLSPTTPTSTPPQELTLPMRRFETLPAQEYRGIVVPEGGWGQPVRFNLDRGVTQELQISQASVEERSVRINGKLIDVVPSAYGPAILTRHEGQLERISMHSEGQWNADVQAVSTKHFELRLNDPPQGHKPVTVNFANTFIPLSDFDRGQRTLDDAPLYSQGTFSLRDPIDIDGDEHLDTVIAAIDQPALCALSHEGQTLWATSFSSDAIYTKSTIPLQFQFNSKAELGFPSIQHLKTIPDQNGDGLNDLFAQIVFVDFTGLTVACFVSIDSATGQPIHSVSQMLPYSQDKPWPADGVFLPEKMQYRKRGAFTSSHGRVLYINRRYNAHDFHIRQQMSRWPRRIATPSPPVLLINDGEIRIASLQGNLCTLFALSNHQQPTQTIKLPFTPAHAPRLAGTGRDARLIFISQTELYQNAGMIEGTEVLAYDAQGTLKWQTVLQHLDWVDSVGHNHNDWPLVSDLNGDGLDEVIFPRQRQRYERSFGIQIFDAASGREILAGDDFAPVQELFSTGLARLTVADDLDNDGWKDIATASLSLDSATSTELEQDNVFAYVDWISSRDGRSLSWARHKIHDHVDQPIVIGIDAIRSVPRGSVEIDVVVGRDNLDTNLASQVIRFHPSDPNATEIANGLDVCPAPANDQHDVRAYRRRGGPYGLGDDMVSLIRKTPSSPLRLGSNNILATWNENGLSLVAVHDQSTNELAVFDASSLETLWTHQFRQEGSNSHVLTVWRGHTVDFLVQTMEFENETDNRLLEGWNGDTLCELPTTLDGRAIAFLETQDATSALVVGDGSLQGSFSTNRINAFKMSLVNLRSGAVRWSSNFLSEANRHNKPQTFSHLQLADLNGDGTEDVVGSDSRDGVLFLAAWNGKNGDRLWERSMYYPSTDTDYSIQFTTVQSKDSVSIVYFGLRDEDAEHQTLNLCSSTGTALDFYEPPDGDELQAWWFDRWDRNACLSNVSSDKSSTRVAWGRKYRNQYHCTIFDTANSKLQVTDEHRFDWNSGNIAQIQMADVDEDGTVESLLLAYDHQRPADASKNIRAIQHAIRLPIDSATPTFTLQLSDLETINGDTFRREGDQWVSWKRAQTSSWKGVCWNTGQTLEIAPNGVRFFDQPPAVCRLDADGNGIVACPTPDGLEARQLESTTQAADSAVTFHSVADPRLRRQLFADAGVHSSLAELLASLAHGLAAIAALVTTPFWYVRRSLRHRRWGIRWLLTLPAVVGVWMYYWQNFVDDRNDLAVTLLYGIAAFAGIVSAKAALRSRQDRHLLAIRMTLSVGTVGVFLIVSAFELFRTKDEPYHYVLAFDDSARVLLLCYLLVSLIYAAVYLITSFLKRLMRNTFAGRNAAAVTA
ncbi:serine/threonine protein kinase [Rhodopirellula sp. MGV]|uniref:serine/threonine protein kinase n=1 Tax=Rhodopirellula sp. MGV TaxID=2023130 RepID=UPI000B973CC7|nr:serine/threonine-protein kinase [Rhodopirellula sp. MGV]OYP36510.1 hypothetical protein CGZ80_08265 [Rhodopirellula sp. MGV]PNY37849.1 serine/threonine protein kinase [Rhodopirellula baltica]